MLEPSTVVLAGPANAGKSTLFNVLVGSRRAVVSEEPGTTRDLVVERVQLGAYPVDLVDTAGERAIEDAVGFRRLESLGIDLGREARRAADLVIWLAPGPADSPPPEIEEGATVRVVTSRADDPESPGHEPISALHRPGDARAVVARLFRSTFELPAEPWARGAGVPFEPGHEDLLRRLAATRDAATQSQATRAALGSLPETSTGGVAVPRTIG